MRTKSPSSTSRSVSVLSRYLREIGAIALLKAEEEGALADRIQYHKDQDARQMMMRANLRLVVNMAKRYAPDHDQDTLLDLIQEGNLGLLRAVDRFRSERKTRFSTYAVYWIRQAILRALKSRRIVRLPENVADQVLRMQRVRQMLYQVLGRAPALEELAQEMRISLPEARRLEEGAAEVMSLDQVVMGRDDGDRTTLQELLEDEEAPRPAQVAHLELLRTALDTAVQSLPEREKEIVELRFGLGGRQPHTLEDIGQKFHISRERVRQLQNTALGRLRQKSAVVNTHQ